MCGLGSWPPLTASSTRHSRRREDRKPITVWRRAYNPNSVVVYIPSSHILFSEIGHIISSNSIRRKGKVWKIQHFSMPRRTKYVWRKHISSVTDTKQSNLEAWNHTGEVMCYIVFWDFQGSGTVANTGYVWQEQ